MRFLLDEMYPQAIAEQLRAGDHDVYAVVERGELRTLPDHEIFAAAQQELRAVVTENIADFARLASEHDRRGHPHHGLILVDPGKYQRGDPRTIGRMVTALDQLLGEHPQDLATSLRHWI
ncbi:MAG: DUF5615 family PIN-like protein [Solirubrobacterales bacterium]